MFADDVKKCMTCNGNCTLTNIVEIIKDIGVYFEAKLTSRHI